MAHNISVRTYGYLANRCNWPPGKTWVLEDTAEYFQILRLVYVFHSDGVPNNVDRWQRARPGNSRCDPYRSRHNDQVTCDRNGPSASEQPRLNRIRREKFPCRSIHRRKLWQ